MFHVIIVHRARRNNSSSVRGALARSSRGYAPPLNPATSNIQPHPLSVTANGVNANNLNVPAYAWMQLVVPTNAVSLSFDYEIQGDWQSDLLAVTFNSTNAQLSVENLAFAIPALSTLSAQASESNLILSWLMSTGGYALQTTTNLADHNSWTTLTNVPAIVNLQNPSPNPSPANRNFTV